LGRSVVPHAEAMELAALAAAREVSGADERIVGNLTLATTTTLAAYLLAEDVVLFRERYPGISLRIKTGYGFADLSRGEADVTIRASDDPGDYLVGRRVATYHQCIYGTPDYLEQHPPTVRGSGCLWMDWRTEESFRRRQKRSEFPLVEHYMQVDDEILLLQLVRAGMGIGTIPCFYGDTAPGLIRAGTEPPEAVRGVWLLAHPDLAKNARVRAFLDFFGEVLARKLPLLTGGQG
jgi:DNA-binding transcriptional LysR family regulator